MIGDSKSIRPPLLSDPPDQPQHFHCSQASILRWQRALRLAPLDQSKSKTKKSANKLPIVVSLVLGLGSWSLVLGPKSNPTVFWQRMDGFTSTWTRIVWLMALQSLYAKDRKQQEQQQVFIWLIMEGFTSPSLSSWKLSSLLGRTPHYRTETKNVILP